MCSSLLREVRYRRRSTIRNVNEKAPRLGCVRPRRGERQTGMDASICDLNDTGADVYPLTTSRSDCQQREGELHSPRYRTQSMVISSDCSAPAVNAARSPLTRRHTDAVMP